MISNTLGPKLSLLTEEYVLVQAWKKTVSYIRSHNWYADTLELDRAAVDLPDFLGSLVERLASPENWDNVPLRIVPAPKSQRWHIDPDTKMWGPTKTTKADKKIRPLSHVALEDQVVVTALMLCLADRVETLQGDPRTPVESRADRRKVLSYGNRLFCDDHSGGLRHRWGSAKLYRGYFQDYKKFLARPEIVAESWTVIPGKRIVIVHSDLRQFYDRVSPELLFDKVQALRRDTDEAAFFDFASNILCWNWHRSDEREVAEYAKQSDLGDFSSVALPQGLVAAGFFSNIVLHDFDQSLQGIIDSENQIIHGATLIDACRYVDDIRLVLCADEELELQEIEDQSASLLQILLDQHAKGLIPSRDKTHAAQFRGDKRPLVRQSRKMERIQHTISGGFDASVGEEILDAIQGLVRSQSRYSKERIDEKVWGFAPVPDVRDETVSRFAAARFRSTFRSLRPLLENQDEARTFAEDEVDSNVFLSNRRKTQEELDDEARTFALGLIENWVEDPSNVRLLLIGLDLWPAKDVIEKVFELINPYTTKSGKRKAPRRVAWYCLAEIFRAGATETGFVADGESLPDAVNIEEYRKVLLAEAIRLTDQNHQSLPWYLKQQILLYLAANNPQTAPVSRRGSNLETKHYRDLIRFLKGETSGLSDKEFAIYAILARRSFLYSFQNVKLAAFSISSRQYRQIAKRDPSFAVEINNTNPGISQELHPIIRQDLFPSLQPLITNRVSLASLVLGKDEEMRGQLCNELTLLEISRLFLEKAILGGLPEVISPSDVLIEIGNPEKYETRITSIDFQANRVVTSNAFLYRVPIWCEPERRWRLQLGYLLRFILTGSQDFTRRVTSVHWKEGTSIYRIPESHWIQRNYGYYNGQSEFGADWLPITDWIEKFLCSLLAWPGCHVPTAFHKVNVSIPETLSLVSERISELEEKKGELSELLMLPLSPGWPETPSKDRPLRICVVQAVIPTPKDIKDATDLTLSDPSLRRKHRRHLSAALEAVKSMLDLRETHKQGDGRLDFMIFPELSVHPKDVETHLIPFARAYKTIILAGLTYEELFCGKPLVNSALWLIPIKTDEGGLQIIRRRQGKEYLAPSEKRRNHPQVKLQGFRPCQWLIGYKWDKDEVKDPLWLTGSICFDATDIRLAADLRNLSDVFAVAAMNRDVSTFDQMALALQYHMFQMVIVANNGTFGGSNAYAPYREPYKRQVFHMHGQPQASIAFLEIDDIDEFLRRDKHALEEPMPISEKGVGKKKWKCPPAGICSGDSCLHLSD